MKLPSGYGSVYKLSGNRRKPWIARVTTGWEIDVDSKTKRQLYQTLGYCKTKKEALQLLADYNKAPYSLEEQNITFKEIYQKWEKEHTPKVTEQAARLLENAFQHFSKIHDMPFREIKVATLEGCIFELSQYNEMQVKMKSLANQMYKWAIRHEYIGTNYAALCDVRRSGKPKIVRTPFSDTEIQTLFENLHIPFSDAVLIGIYTGFRPSELMDIRTDKINFEDQIIIGGTKTKAGTNRIVPIHSRILPLIKNRYNEKNEFLFTDDRANLKHIFYDSWKKRFLNVCKFLETTHLPHDTRHTFATKGKRAGMDEYILKRIMGHKITDITEAVYTHREVEELHTEIEKIK